MKEQTENRRVRMTKQLMKTALLELLEQKPLASISVTAICEKADVHRSTFYKYYVDPADLFKDIEQDILDQIPMPENMPDNLSQEKILEITTAYFDDIQKNANTYRILFSESAGTSFTKELVNYLSNVYVSKDNSNDASERYINVYIANGTVGMLREWIDADFPISSRQIAEMMYFLSKKVSS